MSSVVTDISSMSDEDILAMPDDDYMNDLQLAYFKAKLLALEDEILLNAKKTTDTLQDNSVGSISDLSDRATLEEGYALELRSRNRERKLLQKIRRVLLLIENHEYGFCEDTGEKIGLKRLLIRPTATLSVEAQERRDNMQRHFAD